MIEIRDGQPPRRVQRRRQPPPGIPDYRLLNARNRVAALEYERDHPEQFSRRSPKDPPIAALIARAKAALAKVEAARDSNARQKPTTRHRAGDLAAVGASDSDSADGTAP